MSLKYLKSGYVPKGELEGFPLEVNDKMIERQVEQGNKDNVWVFERSVQTSRDDGGFTWWDTVEDRYFWKDVIVNKNFDLFFKKFPKTDEKELPLPRVIEVREGSDDYLKRVVFMFKNGKAICWKFAETLEDAKDVYDTVWWDDWREVQDGVQEYESQPEPEDKYQPFDFSNGVRDYSYMMDKIIVNKDIDRMFKVSELFYDDILKTSHINDFECEYLFNHCEFEDGSVVGVKV